MIDLIGKVILVVGGSGLLGRDITLTLARCGATVIPTYKSNIDGLPLAQGHFLSGTASIEAGIYLNVNNPDHLEDVSKIVGMLDGLVYCAGQNIPNPFDQITQDDWQTIIQTNLTGAFNVTQALLPQIQDGGSVVFIGSVSAALAGPTSTHYACAKSGLVTLSQNLALFAASRQIRVNTVSPGYVQSPMAEAGQQSEAVRKKVEQIPLGRLCEPKEVSPLVVFLMDGNLSGYITGQNFHINGGLVFGN